MKMEREASGMGPVVSAIGPRGFRVDDGYYTALLLTPESAHGWSPPPLEALAEADLAALLDANPEFLLLGTGTTLARPPVAFVHAVEARGIGVEAMDSRAAARAWGVLRAEGRTIAAALYPL